MTTILKSVLILTLAATLCPARPDAGHEQRRGRNPEQGSKVSVRLDRGSKLAIVVNGSINITGWDGDTVEAQAGDDLGPDTVLVKTTQESGRPKIVLDATKRGGVDLSVRVPRYAEIDSVECRSGDISVSNLEGSAKIVAHSGNVRISRVGSVELTARSGDVVVVDASGSAVLSLGSGDLEVRGVKGNLVAKLVSGDLSVEGVDGLVDLNTSSGDVGLSRASSDVRIVAASGDIHVNCVKRDVYVSTANGNVTLMGIEGDVDASSAAGDMTLTAAVRAGGRYRLHTVSGEVHMSIQPNPPGFTATMQSYSGELITDFKLKLETPMTAINRKLIGIFGDGKAQIALDTFNGTARLSRAGAIKGCN